MEFMKSSFKLAGKHSKRLFAGMVLIVIQNASMLIGFVALYFGFTWKDEINLQRLITLFTILAISLIFNFLAGWLQNKLVAGVFFTIFKDYRLKVGQKLKNAPMGYFAEQSLSHILAGFTNVMKSLESYSSMAITFTLSGISVAAFLTIGMMNMNIKIGVVTIVCNVIILFIATRLMEASKKEIANEHKCISDMSDALVDSIRGVSVLRSFPNVEKGTVERIHSRLSKTTRKLTKVQTHFEVVFVLFSRIFTTVINLSSFIITVYSCYLYTTGEVMLPQALTLSAAGFMLFGGLRQLENSAILMVKNPAHMKYLEEVLDIPEIQEGTIETMEDDKTIEFNNVVFEYTKGQPVINDLSFTIPQGSKTAIVGPSGSGKTTIINLISRFYDPQKGVIKIASKNIKDYKIETLLKNLSLVFQDVYLFNDTIGNNISFAKPSATKEEIIEAAKKARCHEFIMELPQGYDTMVGEGGSSLSGGEKQRISIARALLKNAPIILLDEATSSVDPENEYEILSAIEQLCKGRTVISIAHRLSTVKNADQILVIENGKLAQQGNHNQLIHQKGIYSSFIEAREKAAQWKLA